MRKVGGRVLNVYSDQFRVSFHIQNSRLQLRIERVRNFTNYMSSRSRRLGPQIWREKLNFKFLTNSYIFCPKILLFNTEFTIFWRPTVKRYHNLVNSWVLIFATYIINSILTELGWFAQKDTSGSAFFRFIINFSQWEKIILEHMHVDLCYRLV